MPALPPVTMAVLPGQVELHVISAPSFQLSVAVGQVLLVKCRSYRPMRPLVTDLPGSHKPRILGTSTENPNQRLKRCSGRSTGNSVPWES